MNTPLHLLLVENDDARAGQLRRCIGDSWDNAVIQSAWRLEDALVLCAEHRFDICLLSLSLTDCQGTAALAKLAARCPDLPIVVLVPVQDHADIQLALAQGAADYLVSGQLDPLLLRHVLLHARQREAAGGGLARNYNLLYALVNALPDNIFVKDHDGRYVIDNAAHQRFIGATAPEEVVGKTVFDLFPREMAESYAAGDRAILSGRQAVITHEEPIVDGFGRQRWVSTTKSPLRNSAGDIEGVAGISRDITERKQAEDRRAADEQASIQTLAALKASHEELMQTQLLLIQAEKMDSVGRLAAGVAHEVKNPLAIMLMGVDYLAKSLGDSQAAIASVLDAMRNAIRRADGIIRGLVDFSASRQLELKVGNLNTVLQQSLLLVNHELVASHICLARQLAENLPPVALDASKMAQVFVNVLMNAIYVMVDRGGTLTVRTRATVLAESQPAEGLRASERLREGDTAVIAEVEDSGAGIPADKISKVFDAFFTTKPTGKGSGLGLTVAQKIVDLHGGCISIANRSEGGVRVSIMLKAYRSDHA